MPRLKRAVVRCEKCNSEFEVSESFAKSMRYCPACSSALAPPIEEVQKDLKFLVASYIDKYGMDFVLDAIKSIKMEEGVIALQALVDEWSMTFIAILQHLLHSGYKHKNCNSHL